MTSQETDNQATEKETAPGVGPLLKATRFRINEDLRYVAEALHIRYVFLEAIEEGRYDELPGTAYALGFIRTYSEYLGLDSEEIVRRYKEEVSTDKAQTKLVFPVPVSESSVPGGAVVFIGIILAVLAYGVWYMSTAKDGYFADLVSPIPERLNSLVDKKDQPDPASSDDAKKAVETTQPPQPQPTLQDTVTETVVPSNSTTPDTVNSDNETSSDVEPAGQNTVEQDAPEPVKAVEETAEKVETATEDAQTAAQEQTRELQETAETSAQDTTSQSAATDQAETAQAAAEEAASETVAAAEETVTQTEDTPQTASPSTEQVAQETVQETSQEAASEAVEETVTETVTAPATEALQETTASEQEETPVTEEPAETAQQAESTAEETPQPQPQQQAAAPTGRVYGDTSGNARIEIRAVKNSWIQIKDDVAKKLVMTRLLRPGDSYHAPDQAGLKLLTGNAEGLEIYVDGKLAPEVAGEASLQRGILLDPEQLRTGTSGN